MELLLGRFSRGRVSLVFGLAGGLFGFGWLFSLGKWKVDNQITSHEINSICGFDNSVRILFLDRDKGESQWVPICIDWHEHICDFSKFTQVFSKLLFGCNERNVPNI